MTSSFWASACQFTSDWLIRHVIIRAKGRESHGHGHAHGHAHAHSVVGGGDPIPTYQIPFTTRSPSGGTPHTNGIVGTPLREMDQGCPIDFSR